MIRLAIGANEHGAAQLRTAAAAVLVIGRDARCDIVLTTPGISATHCRLSPMAGVAGAWVLEDLGSSYGTYVNGIKVARPVVVSPTDAIMLGTQAVRIVAGDADASAFAALAGPVLPPPAAAAVALTAPRAWQDHYGRFDALAQRWDAGGRRRTELVGGATLAEAQAWLDAGRDQQPAPQPLHRDFVQASVAAGRRSIVWIGAAATVVLAVAATGAWWWRQANTPDAPVVDAPSAPTDAVVATAVPDDDTNAGAWDLAALSRASLDIDGDDDRLAVQAELARLPGSLLTDGRFALLADVAATLAPRRGPTLRAGKGAITALAWTPRGHTLVAGDNEDAVTVWQLDAPSPTVPLRLLGHVGAITALTVGTDGRTLISASDDRTLRRWDLAAEDPGASAAVLRGHEGAIVACAIAPDGRWAVSGDAMGALRAWDVSAATAVPGESPPRKDAHEGPVTDLRFEPSGTVLSAGDDRTLRRWRIEPDGALRPMTRFEGATSGLTRIAIDRTGHALVAGAADGSIALWQTGGSTTEPLGLRGHTESINDLVVTADGRTLVSASDDDTLRVWDLSVADPSIASIVFAGHTGDVTAIGLAGADTRVVSVALDHGVRAWDLSKKDRVVDQITLSEHTGGITALAITPDGRVGASASDDGEVRLWDPLARTGGLLGEALRAGPAILVDGAVADDGTLLVAGGGGRVELWPGADAARISSPRRPGGATGTGTAVAIDSGARRAVVGTDAGVILLWSIADLDAPPKALGGHTGAINRLAFVGNGARLVSAGSDGTLRVWPLEGGSEPEVLRGHSDEIGAMAHSADGRWVVTGSLDGTLVRWDLAADAIATSAVVLAGHEGEIRALAISPDGTSLVSGGADRRARVWTLGDGRTAHTLRGHEEAISAVAFGPGGRRLATGGADGEIRVWSLEADHPDESSRPLAGHTQTITELVFVDHDVLASASNDGSVRLWQLATDETLVLTGHDGPIKRLLHTGGSLVSVSYDGSARRWPIAGPELAARICDVIGMPADRATLAALLGPRAPSPGCAPPKKP